MYLFLVSLFSWILDVTLSEVMDDETLTTSDETKTLLRAVGRLSRWSTKKDTTRGILLSSNTRMYLSVIPTRIQ